MYVMSEILCYPHKISAKEKLLIFLYWKILEL